MFDAAAIRCAFILAAGFGTRMGSWTAHRPKPLLPVDGAPLLAHALFRLREWGVQRVVVNVHYCADQIIAALRDVPDLEILISHEREILGTAGGVRRALKQRLLPDPDEPILLLNPDSILLPGPADVPEAPDPQIDTALFVHPRAPDASVTGFRFRSGMTPANAWDEDRNDDLVLPESPGGLIEMDPHGEWFYGGYAILRPRITTELEPETFAELGPLWKRAGEAGRLYGRAYQGQLLDAGDKASYESLRNEPVLTGYARERWREFLAAWSAVARFRPE